jgi:hypothetical protein
VTNLGIKIGTVQTNIRDSIVGKATCCGFQASFGAQQQQQNQQRQRFTHKAGLQRPSKTQHFDPDLASSPTGSTSIKQSTHDPSNVQDAAMQDLSGTCPAATKVPSSNDGCLRLQRKCNIPWCARNV